MARQQRRIHDTPQQRRKPDYRKLSAALQAYLAAQTEVDAEQLRNGKPPRREGKQ